MAENYATTTQVQYLGDGSVSDTYLNDPIGSADTDDGVWNVGDVLEPGSFFEFAGSYENGGDTFLVFHDPAGPQSLIASPTAAPGAFPTTYQQGEIGLTTTDLPVCFAAGTRIATPEGEVGVETLEIGAPILTADGRTVPVKWIGRQTVHKVFTPTERFEPVRVEAGALGDGLPRRDLVLTADHALLVEGVLVNASALVNGATITRVPKADLPDRVTYYHVETEGHEMILAEGVAAETFVDHQSRRLFDNYAEYAALYGEERRSIPESDLPSVTSSRQLPAALRSRLARLKSA